MTSEKTTIIHLMNHPPAYEMAGDRRPDINWDVPGGAWVGIWGYDWSDLLAIEVEKVSDDFRHEIWQPDYRADKVYRQELHPNVSHCLFPAGRREAWHGLKKTHHLISPAVNDRLRQQSGNTVLHIAYPIHAGLYRDAIESFRGKILLSFHGQITLPYLDIFKFQKNLPAKVNHVTNHLTAKKLFKKISHVTYQSEVNFPYLRHYYAGPATKLTMGIDFDNFPALDPAECRRELGLPADKKILLTVCRICEIKQLVQLIEVLAGIEQDFVTVIVGSGDPDYEAGLREQGRELVRAGKLVFLGYRRGLDLVKCFRAADLFLQTSRAEAGPVVTMEAIACDLPVFTTATGHVAEVLRTHECGLIAPTHDYAAWGKQIRFFLNGGRVRKLNRKVAQQHYSWRNIALAFRQIYEDLAGIPQPANP